MAIDFQPLDPNRPVRIYHRNLPHWRQDGATYFVTFRLHDSLPGPAVDQLRALREHVLRHQHDPALYLQADREYFREMKHYLEAGHGACWLRTAEASTLVAGALRFFDGDRYQLGEAAVMPNHVHALVRPLPGFELEDILQTWKSYSAKQVNRHLGREGRFWQDETYDRLVRDALEFARTERYICGNRAGH